MPAPRHVVRSLGIALALFVTACGDGDTADTTTTADTTAAESTQPAPSAPPPTEPSATDPAPTAPGTVAPPPTEPRATDPEPTVTEPPVTAPEPTTPGGEVVVNVYWAWEVETVPVCCPERIGAGGRQVSGPATARAALDALLDGPNALETEIGMLTTIPSGTRLLDLAVADGVATVDLSLEFEESSGSLIERMRVAQVVFTLTQFDEIERVMFRIDGEDRDVLMSHGIPVDEGVTRDDDPAIRPAILVEDPYPGADVTTPLAIRGESNTFEATVQYTLTAGGGDGRVVTDGFTTATAGNGVWGTFETTIDLAAHPETYMAGPGSLIVFETSAEDGAMINVVEYPITLPAIIFSS